MNERAQPTTSDRAGTARSSHATPFVDDIHNSVGHRAHVLFALLHLIFLPLTPMGSAASFALLISVAAIRIRFTWRCYVSLLRMPIVLVLASWAAWLMLSLLWSADREQGLDEIGSLYMLLLPVALLPVLGRATWLIGAVLVGVAIQNIAQVIELVIHISDVDASSALPRAGGLIHPIKTGIWCATAMCWHLAAMMRGSTRIRMLSAAGFLLAASGLILAQSRGPWLAALIAIPLELIVILFRDRISLRSGLLAGAGFLIISLAAWPFVNEIVMQRFEGAVDQYDAAVSNEQYKSDVGLRIGLWRWAWDIFLDDPITGRGAGSFRIAQSEQPSFQNAIERWPDRADRIARDHPHNTFLHHLALTGLIGGLLFLSGLALALRQAWRDPNDHRFAHAHFFIVIAWIVGGQFDCYHLSGQYLGLFTLIIALTLPQRLENGRCVTQSTGYEK